VPYAATGQKRRCHCGAQGTTTLIPLCEEKQRGGSNWVW
jgi:hypothetical protein